MIYTEIWKPLFYACMALHSFENIQLILKHFLIKFEKMRSHLIALDVPGKFYNSGNQNPNNKKKNSQIA